MTEIFYIETWQGDEFRIIGDKDEVRLEWKYPKHDWDILYYCQSEDLEHCLEKLHEEMVELSYKAVKDCLTK